MQDIFGIYACARENIYATFRAKVIKITYRSMVEIYKKKKAGHNQVLSLCYKKR